MCIAARDSLCNARGLLKGLTMPQQMSSQDVLRELKRVRFSPRKGRRLGLSWIAGQAGYRRESLYRVMNRGWIGTLMAAHIGRVLQNVTDCRNQVAPTLGPYGGGSDPRGGPRFARRPDDRRLRTTRSQ